MHKQPGDSLLWRSGFHFGDWLAFASTASDYPGATTDKDLLANAFFAHSTDLLARSAEALGKSADALALEFDLLPPSLRADGARRLAEDVRKFRHLTTGFLGTPYLTFALGDNGYLAEAYMLLLRKQYP